MSNTDDLAVTEGTDSWKVSLERLDECPWPGPRPLNSEDAAPLLVGRARDEREFLHVVKELSLIAIHGVSGVGKSSLLNVGLLPRLVDDGFVVVKCDDYGWDTAAEGLDDLAATMRFLAGRVIGQVPDLGGGESEFFANFANSYGSKGVVVLDQFEELMRFSQANRDRVFEFILRLNKLTKTKIVISLRSDHLHELQFIERNAKPFTYTQYELRMVKEQFAEDTVMSARQWVRDGTVVETGSSLSGTESIHVPEDIARLIAEHWRQAISDSRRSNRAYDPFGRVGLLHLQAFLYGLYQHQKRESDSDCPRLDRIGAEDVKEVEDSLRDLFLESQPGGSPEEHSGVVDVFRGALLQTADTKLALCREASLQAGFDEYLVQGTADYVARMAPHLSSGGFKVVREASDLAGMALGGDFNSLLETLDEGAGPIGLQSSSYRALFGTMISLISDQSSTNDGSVGDSAALELTSTRSEIASAADDRLMRSGEASSGPASWTWSEQVGGEFKEPWDADRLGATCGVLAGLPPVHALIEELRRFVLAIWWLHESSLIRVTKIGSGRVMVSLIHDGFGAALSSWERRGRGDPRSHLFAITTQPGISLAWRSRTIGPDKRALGSLTRDDGSYVILPNLNWRGLTIESATFERAVFVNCDFRGALWLHCDFTGVSFVNCHMDGVIFSGCFFRGTPRPSETLEAELSARVGLGESSASSNAGLRSNSGGDDLTGEAPPRYVVPVSDGLMRSFQRFRVDGGREELGSGRIPAEPLLYSPVPGAPATPNEQDAGGRHNVGRLWRFEPVDGGVAIFGGRVSSFVLRACNFTDGGIALHRTAGSGIELVDLSKERTESRDRRVREEISGPTATNPYLFITSSAIRNLTLSSVVKRGELRTVDARQAATADVDVVVEDSLLAQTWIGQGLVGDFRVTDSTVVQVWNEATLVSDSDPERPWTESVSAGISHGCRYFGIVGVSIEDDTCVEMVRAKVGHESLLVAHESDATDESAVRDSGERLLAATRQLDYVEIPAKADRELSRFLKNQAAGGAR